MTHEALDTAARRQATPLTLAPFDLANDLEDVYRLQLLADPRDVMTPRQLARFACGSRRLYLHRLLGRDDATPGCRPPVIAYIAFTPAKVTAVVEQIVVHPMLRRRGVAAELLRQLKASKNPRHTRPVVGCHVRESDLPAQLLLRSAGFVCFETHAGRFSHPDEPAYTFAWCNPAFPEEYAAVAPQLLAGVKPPTTETPPQCPPAD